MNEIIYNLLLDRLKEYTTTQKMRYSKEREKILYHLSNESTLSEHFDADELFALLKMKRIDVSRATVFRNLNIFVEAGILRKIKLGDNHSHYEVCKNRKYKHDHLVCVKCNKVVEFFDFSINKRQKEIAAENGFELTDHKHELYGICKDCKENNDGL